MNTWNKKNLSRSDRGDRKSKWKHGVYRTKKRAGSIMLWCCQMTKNLNNYGNFNYSIFLRKSPLSQTMRLYFVCNFSNIKQNSKPCIIKWKWINKNINNWCTGKVLFQLYFYLFLLYMYHTNFTLWREIKNKCCS